jgi:hypothetical protein
MDFQRTMGDLPLALEHRLRCENCGERGKVELTINWADK